MRPRFPHKVTVRNPGTPTASETTGNTVPGTATEVVTPAYLSQRPVENLSSAIEIRGRQDTAIALFSLLVPPGVVIGPASTVVDAAGRLFEVQGVPAARSGVGSAFRRVEYIAASLRLVSDLQGVT